MAVITMDEARLWTDGRYFIQAAAELKGTEVILMKMGEPGVPTVKEYLEATLGAGQVLGFDGRCVDYGYACSLEQMLHKNDARIVYQWDLIDEIWEDRPALVSNEVKSLDIKYCGEERSSKLARIRNLMKIREADLFVLTTLDDIAWLYNIRGNDIMCNPVVLSYAVISMDDAVIHGQEEAFTGVKEELSKDNIIIKPYNDIYEDMKNIPSHLKVYMDAYKANFAIVKNIPENIKLIQGEN